MALKGGGLAWEEGQQQLVGGGQLVCFLCQPYPHPFIQYMNLEALLRLHDHAYVATMLITQRSS